MLKPYVRVIIALAVVAGLFAWFGVADLAATLRRASPAWLMGYVALTAVVTLGYSTRWWLLTRAVGAPLSLGRCVTARLAGDAVGALVPSAKLAGEPLRVGLVCTSGAPVSAATAGVTLDRMLEIVGNSLAVVAYVGVLLLTREHELGGYAPVGLGLTMLVLLAAICSPVVAARRGYHPFGLAHVLRARVASPRLTRWFDGLVRVEAHLARIFRSHPRIMIAGLAATVLTELLIIAQYHVLLAAFGIQLGLPTLLLVLLGGGLSRAIPTPAGLGALEATQTVLVGAASGRPDLGFLVAIIVRLHETFLLAIGLAALSLHGIARPRAPLAAAHGTER